MMHLRATTKDLLVFVKQWKWLLIYIAGAIVVGVFSVVYLFQYIAVHVQLPNAPFIYPQTVYQPLKMDWCAGEIFPYTYTRTLISKDFVKVEADTIYQEVMNDKGEVRYRQAQVFALRGVAIGELPITDETSNLITLSTELEPGNYVLQHEAQDLFSKSSGFTVRFRIVECPEAGTE